MTVAAAISIAKTELPAHTSMPSALFMDDQKVLSERLLLLKELGVRQSLEFVSELDGDSDLSLELRTLNTLALLLATGNGDAYAVAFDDASIIIAKNGLPTQEDVEYAKTLLTLIPRPHALEAILPIVVPRCVANINKRIQSIHASLLAMLADENFDSAVAQYAAIIGDVLTREFPGRRGEQFLDGRDYRNFSDAFAYALQMVKDLSADGLSTDNIPSAIEGLQRLCYFAHILSDSCCLRRLQHNRYDLRGVISHFQKQCSRLWQYFDDVATASRAIARRGRAFQRLATIPHRWVMDRFTGATEGLVQLAEDLEEALTLQFEVAGPVPSYTWEQIKLDSPTLRENWTKLRSVRTYVHAAMRLILHFGPIGSGSSQRALGLTDGCCLACATWIREYNWAGFGVSWKTSASEEIPCPTWAIPSSTWPSSFKLQRGDEDINRTVMLRMKDQLWVGFYYIWPPEYKFTEKIPGGQFIFNASCDELLVVDEDV